MEIVFKNKILKIDEDNLKDLTNNSWAFDSNNYLSNRSMGINDRFHRYIMRSEMEKYNIETGLPINKIKIDHINRDVLDNRKSNLRCVTHSENIFNRPKQSNNKSGYKGVSSRKIYNTTYYVGSIQYKGKQYQKAFKTLQEAIDYRKSLVLMFKIVEPT